MRELFDIQESVIDGRQIHKHMAIIANGRSRQDVSAGTLLAEFLKVFVHIFEASSLLILLLRPLCLNIKFFCSAKGCCLLHPLLGKAGQDQKHSLACCKH